MAQRTVLLLGDSILDNQPYTGGSRDTATHLRSLLGAQWTVELLARDGAIMSDISSQLRRIPTRDAAAFVSIGGNDLTQHIELLARPSTNAEAVLAELLEVADRFSSRYDDVARSVGRSSPSARGARKIADAIANVLHDEPSVRTARIHSAA